MSNAERRSRFRSPAPLSAISSTWRLPVAVADHARTPACRQPRSLGIADYTMQASGRSVAVGRKTGGCERGFRAVAFHSRHRIASPNAYSGRVFPRYNRNGGIRKSRLQLSCLISPINAESVRSISERSPAEACVISVSPSCRRLHCSRMIKQESLVRNHAASSIHRRIPRKRGHFAPSTSFVALSTFAISYQLLAKAYAHRAVRKTEVGVTASSRGRRQMLSAFHGPISAEYPAALRQFGGKIFNTLDKFLRSLRIPQIDRRQLLPDL